ncbi:hypothetical protein K469DRAFT_744484 [Zopfia rhizophila CBS 207.26]|uniref:Uncharacterized protein n=1 Tax=Zopfia rhizophila CBS 207.26 TaxID=1314779 RepID=A0A6A6EQY6_9PEZI|nr:hypothetical protein K469DRAFT_744484 [Zopfia rhizophila CBS 207.26]
MKLRYGPNGPQKGIHWKNPVLMLAFYALAVLCALGHHLLYQYLDGRVPDHQDWYLRAGTAFAVVSKILLSTSVGISFAQRSWKTARSQYLSLGAIDSLFGAASNPLALANVELIARAKLALALTLLIWLSPLITIFTPGSLTTIQKTIESQQRIPVPSLNMTLSSDAFQGNNTAGTLDLFKLGTIIGKQISTFFDGPSNAALAIVYQTVYQGQIVNAESPCGARDCSFRQEFQAPSYHCEDVAVEALNSPWCQISEQGIANKTCILEDPEVFGFANIMYSAGNGSGGVDTFSNVTYGDGNFWFMFRDYDPELRDPNATIGYQSSPYRNVSFRCSIWDTTYKVRRLFSGGTQRMIDTELEKLAPIENATSGYITVSYKISFNGGVWAPQDGLNLAGTKFVQRTPWQKPIDWLPVSDFKQRFEELSQNITLSLFALNNLSYLRMANNTPVDFVSFQSAYAYDKKALLVTYGIAMLLALMVVIVGLGSFLENGVSMNIGFMSIMATTRNPRLDELVTDGCIGAEGLMDGFKDTKVMFGKQPQTGVQGSFRQRQFPTLSFGEHSEKI